jgi:hypothetical protein
MKKLAVLVLCLGLLLALSPATDASDIYAFYSKLHGINEPSGGQANPGPPAPQTGAVTNPPVIGDMSIQFAPDFTYATYQVRVFNGVGITQAHFHCGVPGINGPIMVFLFGLNPAGVAVNGVLASGVITNANILPVDFSANPSCGLTINNLESLNAAMQNGKVYTNAHSLTFPGGVARGQVFPGRLF